MSPRPFDALRQLAEGELGPNLSLCLQQFQKLKEVMTVVPLEWSKDGLDVVLRAEYICDISTESAR